MKISQEFQIAFDWERLKQLPRILQGSGEWWFARDILEIFSQRRVRVCHGISIIDSMVFTKKSPKVSSLEKEEQHVAKNSLQNYPPVISHMPRWKNPLWMEVSRGTPPINGPFSSTPCLMTPEGTWLIICLLQIETTQPCTLNCMVNHLLINTWLIINKLLNWS